MIINDTSEENGYNLFSEHEIGSYIGVPVIYQNGELFGTLCVVDSKPSSFTEKHSAHLQNLARFFSYVLTLENQAIVDTLTGLYNRRYLYQALSNYNKSQLDNKLTIMFIDLDGFKEVNDAFGHDYGDIVLKKVSKRLTEVIFDGGFVARLGGDEFIMVFTHLSEERKIISKAQEILGVLSLWDENDQPINLSASIGIVIYPDDTENVEMAIKYADQSMYVAKHQGKNQFLFYSKL